MFKNVVKKESHRVIENAGDSIIPGDRLAYSPAEFAQMVGRSQTYGYRCIYSGALRVIAGHGRMLIPRAEIERFLASATVYDGTRCKTRKGGRTHGQ